MWWWRLTILSVLFVVSVVASAEWNPYQTTVQRQGEVPAVC